MTQEKIIAAVVSIITGVLFSIYNRKLARCKTLFSIDRLWFSDSELHEYFGFEYLAIGLFSISLGLIILIGFSWISLVVMPLGLVMIRCYAWIGRVFQEIKTGMIQTDESVIRSRWVTLLIGILLVTGGLLLHIFVLAETGL